MPRPFVYNGETCLNSTREFLKVLIACLFIIPLIRFLLIILILVIQWVIVEITAFGWTPTYDKDGIIEPMPAWRQRIIHTTTPISSRLILYCCGVWRIRIRGQYDPSARIVVANHVTIMDAYLLMTQIPFIAVCKKSLQKAPIIGPLCRISQFIFVDRADSEARLDVLMEIKKRAQSGRFPPILIFPEGTTSNSKTLIRFKKGAFSAGLPIQSVALKFPWSHFDPCWTNHSPRLWISMLEILCQPYQRAELLFLPVRTPSRAEIDDPQRYADNTRKTMAQALNVPIVPFSAEDSLLTQWLLERGQYAEIGVSVFELKERFRVRMDQIRSLTDDFYEIDSKRDGVIDRGEFDGFVAKLDPAIDGEFADRVFYSFDSNASSSLEFREFIIGCLTLNDEDDLSEKPIFSTAAILHKGNQLYRDSQG